MRKERMSEEEYVQAKARIRELEESIAPLQEELLGLKGRVRWYEYSADSLKDHSNDRAVKMFGKRFKDLSPEEMREYKKITTRIYREDLKRKASKNDRSKRTETND